MWDLGFTLQISFTDFTCLPEPVRFVWPSNLKATTLWEAASPAPGEFTPTDTPAVRKGGWGLSGVRWAAMDHLRQPPLPGSMAGSALQLLHSAKKTAETQNQTQTSQKTVLASLFCHSHTSVPKIKLLGKMNPNSWAKNHSHWIFKVKFLPFIIYWALWACSAAHNT